MHVILSYRSDFEKILKHLWTFWLDKAKEKTDKIETSEQKNTLLTEYHSSFTNKFTDLLQNSSFEDLPNKFIEKAEEAIQIGKVCLSEDESLWRYVRILKYSTCILYR
jgi:hypothetical protein